MIIFLHNSMLGKLVHATEVLPAQYLTDERCCTKKCPSRKSCKFHIKPRTRHRNVLPQTISETVDDYLGAQTGLETIAQQEKNREYAPRNQRILEFARHLPEKATLFVRRSCDQPGGACELHGLAFSRSSTTIMHKTDLCISIRATSSRQKFDNDCYK